MQQGRNAAQRTIELTPIFHGYRYQARLSFRAEICLVMYKKTLAPAKITRAPAS
jgi:hypothetical protein